MATTQPRSAQPNTSPDRALKSIPPLQGAWWKIGVGLLMTYIIYGAFFIAQGARGFVDNGNPARIVFFHVPAAVLSSVCYAVGTVYALLYLWKRNLDLDAKSAISLELGFLFCILATITGSIFAKIQWNQYWNWDPRETSIVIMLLLYASYLLLRGAAREQPERCARLSAVYAIVALIPAMFLIWIVPRLPNLNTMHPTQVLFNREGTSATYKAVLYPSFLAFTLLFVWMFQLRFRLHKLMARRAERRQAHG